jgi:hypothetical protein
MPAIRLVNNRTGDRRGRNEEEQKRLSWSNLMPLLLGLLTIISASGSAMRAIIAHRGCRVERLFGNDLFKSYQLRIVKYYE